MATPSAASACTAAFVSCRLRQALVLDALGRRQQRRCHLFAHQCLADVPEAGPDGIDEGTAGLLEQMPSLGDLPGTRQRAGNGRPVAAPRSRDATSTPGRPASQASTVPASRSGRRSTIRCRSRSRTIVPERWPFLHARSSMPITRGATAPPPSTSARTPRRSVSLPTGRGSRRAMPCPGRPPGRCRDNGPVAAAGSSGAHRAGGSRPPDARQGSAVRSPRPCIGSGARTPSPRPGAREPGDPRGAAHSGREPVGRCGRRPDSGHCHPAHGPR
jgi:hypothetical protein